jgi:hypothetical protein
LLLVFEHCVFHRINPQPAPVQSAILEENCTGIVSSRNICDKDSFWAR